MLSAARDRPPGSDTSRRRVLFILALAAGLMIGAGVLAGCGADEGVALADETAQAPDEPRFRLLARLVQISDTQIVDEESPGRLAVLAGVHPSAWRPQERYSIHLLDGIIRAINAYHRLVGPIDFVIHTGDATDNAQSNELHWALDCFDGKTIDPLSGTDDRPPEERGPASLDPHAPFTAEGLYRQGVHGPEPSIPWYAVPGNHDRYAIGIFPLVPRLDGGLMAPLPRPLRRRWFLPAALIPDGSLAYGAITPGDPGPPAISPPVLITANAQRRFFGPAEFVEAHFDTRTGPDGHGFTNPDTSWYSLSLAADLRLIVLDTSIPALELPAGIYESGAIVAGQLAFLTTELDRAQEEDELVVVATHHPSFDLSPVLGSAVGAEEFRALLNGYSNVVAHLAGHTHRHRVWDRGGYIEFETASIIDDPQEGRVIEIWQDDNIVELRYLPLAHLYEEPAFANLDAAQQPSDPFVPLRREAHRLAQEHAADDFLLAKQQAVEPSLPLPSPPEPRPFVPSDRRGTHRLLVRTQDTQ